MKLRAEKLTNLLWSEKIINLSYRFTSKHKYFKSQFYSLKQYRMTVNKLQKLLSQKKLFFFYQNILIS